MPVINLTTAKGGINRLRTVGSPSPENLYDLVNGYVNASGGMQSRPGTELSITLPAGTKGLCAFDSKLYVFGITPASTGNALYEVAVTVHPTLPTLALHKIHFAAPFLGALYVVAEFSNGDIVHYWLQSADAWTANTTYLPGDVVEPTTPNGLAYRASYGGDPIPQWAPRVDRNIGDQVVPTVSNGYGYEVVGLVYEDGTTEGENTDPVNPNPGLVDNGGFETGDLTDWTEATAAGAWTVVTGSGGSGTYAVEFDPTAGFGADGILRSDEQIAATPGQPITVTARVNATTGTGVILRLRDNNGGIYTAATITTAQSTTGWRTLTGTVTVTSPSATYVQVELFALAYSGGLVFFDDVSAG